MKKSVLTIIVFFLAASVHFLNAQNLDEILSKHFDASGQKKLNAVSSVYIKANVNQMGTEIPLVMQSKKPNKFRMEMEVMGQKMIQAFDGEKGWVVAPWISDKPQDLTGAELEQAKSQTSIEGDLYNYAAKGFKAEYKGTEDFDGKKAYNIQLTKDDGTVYHYFIDAANYLIVGAKANVQGMDVTQKISGYKNFDGVMVGTKIVSETPMGSSQVSMEEVDFNRSMDDSIFERPTE